MSQWRVSFVFRNAVGSTFTSGSLYGWTENVYCPVDRTPSAMRADAINLLARRVQLLTEGWRVAKIRFAEYPSTRTAFTYSPSPASGRGTYATSATVTDEQPYDKLIVNMLCASGKGRALILGGIGSDVVDAGGVYLAPAAFVTAFTGWLGYLTTNYAVKRAARGPVIPVTNVITTPGGPYVGNPIQPQLASTVAGAAYPDGTQIRISGVQGLAYLNGTWNIQRDPVVAAFTSPVLAQKRGVRVFGTYIGGGTWVGYTYSLDPFTGGSPSRGTSRRTGGSIDRPRGRRSTRRS